MKNTKTMANIAMIAAVYTVLSVALAPISYGAIQCRISEALCLLPIIYKPAIPALILGCFLTNLIGAMSGFNVIGLIDIIFGTLATAIAAWLTYKYRKNTLVAAAMPVIINGIIIGIELGFLYMPETPLNGSLIFGLEVAAGEIIAVVLGLILLKIIQKTKLIKE